MQRVKIRSQWIRVDPKSNTTGVLIQQGEKSHTEEDAG